VTVQVIPVVFESDGGVHEIVLEVSHLTGKLLMLGAVPAPGIPAGITVQAEVMPGSEKPRMIVTVRARGTLPADVLDLFNIRLLAGDAIEGSGLAIRTLSINGEAVDDIPVALPDPPPGPVFIKVDVSDWVADASHVMEIMLAGLGAAVPGTMLIDPDALLDGHVGIRLSGLGRVSEVVLGLAYDSDALLPMHAAATIEGTDVSIVDLPHAGTLELRVSSEAGFLAGGLLLACLAFTRPQGSRRGFGKLRLQGLAIDGVDVPVEQDGVEWADALQAAVVPQGGHGLSIAFPTSGAVHLPDR
jgi:hypothetical protein